MEDSISLISEDSSVDWEELLQFGKDEYKRTFGNLYSEEQLSLYLKESYNLDLYLSWVRNPLNYALFVAYFDGKVSGFCVCSVGSSLPIPREIVGNTNDEICGEIKRIYVSKLRNGTGLAARLLSLASDWLAHRNISKNMIFLGVYSQNLPAIKFYRKHGFKEISYYPYPMIGVEMLLMQQQCPS